MRGRCLLTLLAIGLSAFATGCATSTPYTGQGPHPQLQRGAPFPPVDLIGNILALPGKLILWNWRFNSHFISEDTEAGLVRYLDARQLPAFEDTVYRLNQYAPIADLKALVKNRHVGWPYRMLFGLPTTLLYDVVLPGRLLPWGDYFNPYTNVVHLYSDDLPIALHEAGHAYDYADFAYKGTYAITRLAPFFDLSQEWQASEHAIEYLQEIGDRNMEYRAYKVLWPAFGTYVGSYLPIPLGSFPGALAGHVSGRLKAKEQRKFYERMDRVLSAPERSVNTSGGSE